MTTIWRSNREGDEIEGEILSRGEIKGNFGVDKTLVLESPEGQVTVPLKTQLERITNSFKVGDCIKILYDKNKPNASGKYDYKSFRVWKWVATKCPTCSQNNGGTWQEVKEAFAATTTNKVVRYKKKETGETPPVEYLSEEDGFDPE